MRKKPQHIRKQYAFLVSLAVTLVIFLLWIASYGIGAKPLANTGTSAPTPLSSLGASVGDAFGYIKGLFVGNNKTDYSSNNVEVTGGNN